MLFFKTCMIFKGFSYFFHKNMSRLLPFRNFLCCATLFLPIILPAQSSETLHIPGLEAPVEVLTDRWGVAHIYAQNEKDLFFAQGFSAAQDRLWQLEIWRRQATGTTAEVFGPRELKRDIGARLFRFRGDMDRELNHYHPRGKQIIESFVAGINAYIDWINARPQELPLEFKLTKLQPQHWTPADVISRHQGLLGNIGSELETGRAVAIAGPEVVKKWSWFHPFEPDLTLDPLIDSASLMLPVLELYEAFRKPLKFQAEDLALQMPAVQDIGWQEPIPQDPWSERLSTGSNNWVISGEKTQSGYPMLANDPHRALAIPSLRYMVHLSAPGWNVTGGGEPAIPGISIGHNEHGAWGLTVFSTDAEDLYVYELNPENPDQYRYQQGWETMRQVQDTIAVKGRTAEIVTHRYTRHGPVVYIDKAKNLAYALRCGWLEVGGAPYLASLRMNQATTWEEFVEACKYSHIPGENMIWADKKGNIGWQAVGIAPIRRNFSGLVPVPGDGRFEWDGYLPIQAKPHLYNPEKGYIATANENLTAPDYEFPEVIGFEWSDPFRGDRVSEVLENGKKHTLLDITRLQTDYLSIPARQLVPMLKGLQSRHAEAESWRKKLLEWNYCLDPESTHATVYNIWEQTLLQEMKRRFIPEKLQSLLGLQLKTAIDWLAVPGGKF